MPGLFIASDTDANAPAPKQPLVDGSHRMTKEPDSPKESPLYLGAALALLLVIAGVSGTAGYTKYSERKRNEKLHQEFLVRQAEREAEVIELGLLIGEAAPGMTRAQVLRIWGQPSRVVLTGNDTDHDRRVALINLGVFETLHYHSRDRYVYLDTRGVVVSVERYAD